MSTVRALPGVSIEEPVDQDTVKLLEEILEEAKKGNIAFCALTWKNQDDVVMHAYSGAAASVYEAVGMVDDLKETLKEDL